MTALDDSHPRVIDELIAANALNCRGCGYDLRWQTGKTRRCPECGRVNTLEDLVAAVELHAQSNDNLELFYVFCILPSIFVGLWLVVALIFAPFNSQGQFARMFMNWAGVTIGVWSFFAAICGGAARFLTGWFAAYCYYTIAVLAFGLLIAAGFGAFLLCVLLYPPAIPLLLVVPIVLYFVPWSRIWLPALIRNQNSPYARGRRHLDAIGLRLRLCRR